MLPPPAPYRMAGDCGEGFRVPLATLSKGNHAAEVRTIVRAECYLAEFVLDIKTRVAGCC